LQFAETCGLVKEKENFLLLTFAACNKVSVGVESVSGSGKTVLADIMYIEELQKAMNTSNPIVVEMLKNLTEGKELRRKVYDSTTKTVNKQAIKGDLGIVYSLALENKTKKDEELDRRVITLMTDISQEQNRRVVKYIGKTRFNKSRLKILSDENTEQLRNYVDTVLGMSKQEIENPFAEYIAEVVPVPFVKVRSYVKHYFNLMDSCTKFFHTERFRKGEKIFASIQDVYTIHTLYGRTFNQGIHHLPQLGKDIMDVFDEAMVEKKGWHKNAEKRQQMLFQDEDGSDKLYLNVTKIHNMLKEEGILLKHKVIRNQCDMLVEAGFLGQELSGKNVFFFKTDDVAEFEDNFDFKKCYSAGLRNMNKEYPELIREWLSMQSNEEGRVELKHPITGDIRYLDETTLIEKKIDEVTIEKKDPYELKVTEEKVE